MCHGLVDVVMFSHRLNLMISECFSNLIDCVINCTVNHWSEPMAHSARQVRKGTEAPTGFQPLSPDTANVFSHFNALKRPTSLLVAFHKESGAEEALCVL